jgi:hypothetical protein
LPVGVFLQESCLDEWWGSSAIDLLSSMHDKPFRPNHSNSDHYSNSASHIKAASDALHSAPDMSSYLQTIPIWISRVSRLFAHLCLLPIFPSPPNEPPNRS